MRVVRSRQNRVFSGSETDLGLWKGVLVLFLVFKTRESVGAILNSSCFRLFNCVTIGVESLGCKVALIVRVLQCWWSSSSVLLLSWTPYFLESIVGKQFFKSTDSINLILLESVAWLLFCFKFLAQHELGHSVESGVLLSRLLPPLRELWVNSRVKRYLAIIDWLCSWEALLVSALPFQLLKSICELVANLFSVIGILSYDNLGSIPHHDLGQVSVTLFISRQHCFSFFELGSERGHEWRSSQSWKRHLGYFYLLVAWWLLWALWVGLPSI